MKKSELLAKLETIPDDAELFILDEEFDVWVKVTHVGATTLHKFDTTDRYVEQENWVYDPTELHSPINAICML
jgi:hypothetical protein